VDLEDGSFIKTRRNLLFCSVLLFFLEEKIVYPDKVKFSIGGLMLKNPEQTITVSVWILTIYVMIRFYQQLQLTKIADHPKAIESRTLYYLKIKYLIFHGLIDHGMDNFRIEKIHGRYVIENSYNNNTVKKSMTVSMFDSFMFDCKSNMIELVKTVYFTEFILPVVLVYIPLSIKYYNLCFS